MSFLPLRILLFAKANTNDFVVCLLSLILQKEHGIPTVLLREQAGSSQARNFA